MLVRRIGKKYNWLRLSASKQSQRGRSRQGQSLTELAVGGLVLIPIALAAIDLTVLVLGGQISNDLAKQATRAASLASSQMAANSAVASVQQNFQPSSIFKSLSVKMLQFDNTPDGVVSVGCSVTVVLPVSIPFLNIGPYVPIQTQHTEPIVGISPSS